MAKKYPFIRQLDQMNCGPTCLRMITKFYGKSFSGEAMGTLASITRQGVSLGGLAEAAEKINFSSLALSVPFQSLAEEIPLPCIAFWQQRHYIVVYEATKEKVLVADPAFGILTYTKQEFLKGWLPQKTAQDNDLGLLLLLEPTPQFYQTEDDKTTANSGLGFITKYFKPYHRYFVQLFLGLLVSSFLQLLLPFLTQQIVDTGINTKNLNFIYLVLVAQLVLFFSQTAISIIRSWILMHITSRINLRMLSDFLIKLMNLPIAFF